MTGVADGQITRTNNCLPPGGFRCHAAENPSRPVLQAGLHGECGPLGNQPQVAILGIGTIERRPIVVEDADGNDAIVIKTMSYFGISYDHRLVDGADADRFMIDVKKVLEQDTWTELEAYV